MRTLNCVQLAQFLTDLSEQLDLETSKALERVGIAWR